MGHWENRIIQKKFCTKYHMAQKASKQRDQVILMTFYLANLHLFSAMYVYIMLAPEKIINGVFYCLNDMCVCVCMCARAFTL